jgi:hypothetical protein
MKRKLFALTIAAAVALASGAKADNNTFGFGERLDRKSTLDLGLVRAEADGIVEIYSYHRAQKGALLGSTRVRGGANYDVRVSVGRRPITDVLAVLKVGGRVVATKDYDIDRRQNSSLFRN